MRNQWRQQQLEKLKNKKIKKGVASSEELQVQIGGIDDYELYYDEDENGIMNDEELKNMHYGVVKMNTDEDADSSEKNE